MRIPTESEAACLRSLAETLASCKRGADPEILYNVFADAIFWSDELPSLTNEDAVSCLSYVINYRTGLILGEANHEYRAFWELAKSTFPTWIGFDAARSSPDESLQAIISKYRTNADTWISEEERALLAEEGDQA